MLVPTHQVIALWRPAEAALIVALPLLPSSADPVLTQASFERLLSQIRPESDRVIQTQAASGSASIAHSNTTHALSSMLCARA